MKSKSTMRIFSFIFALTIAGCSSYTGTVSRDPAAFIRFEGISENHTAIVDELAPVQLFPKKGKATLQVEPGKRRIRVLLGQLLLVDRTILISDLQTFEMSVPNP